VRPNLPYADRAHREYAAALAQFDAGDLLDAEERFRQVKRQFGLSRWGWLAELRLADIDFRKENFAQAIQGYRSWIRYHPTQPEVVYAHYMIARSYYGQIPNEWFLVPASWERDQSSTHDAEDAFQRFLADYGTSQYAAPARDYLRRVRELLARGEIHVAEYYLNHNRPDAAISRLREVLEKYAGSGLEPQALLKIGEVFLQTGRRPQAHAAFTALVTYYPRSSYVRAAQNYLRFIGPMPPPPAGSAATVILTPPPPPPPAGS
jgi:outer membrane protein assembly factor BamD